MYRWSQNLHRNCQKMYMKVVQHVSQAHLSWLEICCIGLLDRVVIFDPIRAHPLETVRTGKAGER
jgi:hypothetical protein